MLSETVQHAAQPQHSLDVGSPLETQHSLDVGSALQTQHDPEVGSALQPQRLYSDLVPSPALQITPDLQPSTSPQLPDNETAASAAAQPGTNSYAMALAMCGMQHGQKHQNAQTDANGITPSCKVLPSPSSATVLEEQGHWPSFHNALHHQQHQHEQQSHQQQQRQVLVDMPLVKRLVQSSGAGCKDVLELSSKKVWGSRKRDCWVTRSFQGRTESSCTLLLKRGHLTNITIKVWAATLVLYSCRAIL